MVVDSTKPPLLPLHGSNGCAPIALETYPNLHKEFQVYAIDVLAQPTKPLYGLKFHRFKL
jgi:hypothetical protein